MGHHQIAVVRNDAFVPFEFDERQMQLLKDTICKGATPDEFNLFCMICKHTGLDPFLKQIYPVKRWNAKLQREEMTCQTSIDGYRLVAEKTGKYCPGRESTYTYDKNGHLLSATSYVKKLTSDGTWHEVSATAFYGEYVQTFADKITKEMKPTQFWQKMPHVMLAKCAEALALRKGWPAQLATVYTSEEMGQADSHSRSPRIAGTNEISIDYEPVEDLIEEIKPIKKTKKNPSSPEIKPDELSNTATQFISPQQWNSIMEIVKADVARLTALLNHYEIANLAELPSNKYDEVIEILSQGNGK